MRGVKLIEDKHIILLHVPPDKWKQTIILVKYYFTPTYSFYSFFFTYFIRTYDNL